MLCRCTSFGLILPQELTFWSRSAREARLIFDVAPAPSSLARAITFHVADLQAPLANDERRQAKRSSLADKLTVEATTLADLKVEKAAAEGQAPEG